MDLKIQFEDEKLSNKTFFDVIKQITGPVLVHRESIDDEYVKAVLYLLFSSYYLVIVSTVIGRPSTDFAQVPRSVILLGKTPKVIFESLRGYKLWQGRNRVVVIAEAGSSEEIWLSTAWNLTRAVNIVVTIPRPHQPFTFYTWFPYKYPECNTVATIVEISITKLFPVKVSKNLEQCSFYAVTTELPPLVYNLTHGAESRMVRAVADLLNLKVERKLLPEGEVVWLQVMDNQPVNGLKLVWDNDVDIMFSHQAQKDDIADWADLLVCHLQDAWKWYVPGPRPISRTTAIFLAFTPELWSYVGGAFIVLLLFSAALHLQQHGTFSDCFIRIYLLNLNLSMSWLPSKAFKTFAIFGYIYSVHITTAYQSSLINFLSDVPREKPITTVAELATSSWNVIYHESLEDFLFELATEDVDIATLTSPGRHEFVGRLQLDPVRFYEAAVLGPGIPFGFSLARNEEDIFTDRYGGSKVAVLKETPLILHITMYLSPSHPLTPIFNHYTQLMFETGVTLMFMTIDSHPFSAITIPPEKEPFGLDNVEGAFMLYGFLLTSCFIIFMCELLIAKVLKLVRIRKSLKRLMGRIGKNEKAVEESRLERVR